MFELAAMNVAGRKNTLITASVFMAYPSSLVMFAILVDISAICRLSLLSLWAIRLYTF